MVSSKNWSPGDRGIKLQEQVEKSKVDGESHWSTSNDDVIVWAVIAKEAWNPLFVYTLKTMEKFPFIGFHWARVSFIPSLVPLAKIIFLSSLELLTKIL